MYTMIVPAKYIGINVFNSEVAGYLDGAKLRG
jgi:hypothetical protein